MAAHVIHWKTPVMTTLINGLLLLAIALNLLVLTRRCTMRMKHKCCDNDERVTIFVNPVFICMIALGSLSLLYLESPDHDIYEYAFVSVGLFAIALGQLRSIRKYRKRHRDL